MKTAVFDRYKSSNSVIHSFHGKVLWTPQAVEAKNGKIRLWSSPHFPVPVCNGETHVLGEKHWQSSGWWFQTFFFIIYGIILPIDELIFFKMVKTTNQSWICSPDDVYLCLSPWVHPPWIEHRTELEMFLGIRLVIIPCIWIYKL